MNSTTRLQIKGMVCTRCIAILFDELTLIGLEITAVKLGEVFFNGALPDGIDEIRIQSLLEKYGFSLITDKKKSLVTEIKELIKIGIDLQLETKTTIKFSEFLSTRMDKDYNYLSTVFSDYEGTTIEKYAIYQRIINVKNQLIYTDKSLTEISDEFGYSSVSHLSRQLKAYTGFDTYHYKNVRKNLNILS